MEHRVRHSQDWLVDSCQYAGNFVIRDLPTLSQFIYHVSIISLRLLFNKKNKNVFIDITCRKLKELFLLLFKISFLSLHYFFEQTLT